MNNLIPNSNEFNEYLNSLNIIFKDETSPIIFVNRKDYISADLIRNNFINIKNKLDTIPYQKTCGEVKIIHPDYNDGYYFLDIDGFNPNPPIISYCDMSESLSESINPHSCREASFYDNSLSGTNLTLIDPDGWDNGISPYLTNCNFDKVIPISDDTIVYIEALGNQGNQTNLEVVGSKTLSNNGVYTNSFLINNENSLKFAGKHLSFPIGADSRFDLRSNDITMEGWYYIHDITPYSKSYNHFFSVQSQDFFALKAWLSYIYGTPSTFIQSNIPLPDRTLFHLALVKKGNQITLFVDGKITSRINSTAMNKDMRNKTFYFGYGHSGEPSDYSARKLRISSKALYHEEFDPKY